MEKIDMITEILNLYEENERLTRELAKARIVHPIPDELLYNPSNIEQEIFVLGKKELYEKIKRYSTPYVSVRGDEDGNVVSYTSLEVYTNDMFNKDYIPKSLSFNEVIEFFKEEIESEYEKSKKDALNDYETSR